MRKRTLFLKILFIQKFSEYFAFNNAINKTMFLKKIHILIKNNLLFTEKLWFRVLWSVLVITYQSDVETFKYPKLVAKRPTHNESMNFLNDKTYTLVHIYTNV